MTTKTALPALPALPALINQAPFGTFMFVPNGPRLSPSERSEDRAVNRSERSEDRAVNRALRARIRRKLEAVKQEATQLPRLNCLGRRESVLSTYGIFMEWPAGLGSFTGTWGRR